MGTWTRKIGDGEVELNRLFPSRILRLRNQTLISLAVFLAAIFAAWKFGGWISAGDLHSLAYAAAAALFLAAALTILRSWRTGFYLFVVWLMFEDLVRKFLGNNMAIYFAKDVLLGLTYISFLIAVRRKKVQMFRPPFLVALSLFFWLAVLEVFNPFSPSVFYGLLGLKIYFYYVPLVFLGYALIRNDADLRRFLLVFTALACVVSGVGIIQATGMPHFLSPAILAPDIRELGSLEKLAPLTQQIFLLPSSIFVSAGRFDFFLILASILGLGTAAYFILSATRGRWIIFCGIAVITAAVLLSGSRITLLQGIVSAVVLSGLNLWGAPWRWGQAHRLVKAIRRSVVFAVLGLAVLVIFFPGAVISRMAFYSETLSPGSTYSELDLRAWNYPLQNFFGAFSQPHWVMGNGTGTDSLGEQYVSQILHTPPPAFSVEEGYGQLIIEMGMLGPILWILWTSVLLWTAWKAIRPLRQTRLFPIAAAIFWYAFVLLFPLTYFGLDAFQNFVNNAFLWILIGMLFRLPQIVVVAPQLATVKATIPLPALSRYPAD